MYCENIYSRSTQCLKKEVNDDQKEQGSKSSGWGNRIRKSIQSHDATKAHTRTVVKDIHIWMHHKVVFKTEISKVYLKYIQCVISTSMWRRKNVKFRRREWWRFRPISDRCSTSKSDAISSMSLLVCRLGSVSALCGIISNWCISIPWYSLVGCSMFIHRLQFITKIPKHLYDHTGNLYCQFTLTGPPVLNAN